MSHINILSHPMFLVPCTHGSECPGDKHPVVNESSDEQGCWDGLSRSAFPTRCWSLVHWPFQSLEGIMSLHCYENRVSNLFLKALNFLFCRRGFRGNKLSWIAGVTQQLVPIMEIQNSFGQFNVQLPDLWLQIYLDSACQTVVVSYSNHDLSDSPPPALMKMFTRAASAWCDLQTLFSGGRPKAGLPEVR